MNSLLTTVVLMSTRQHYGLIDVDKIAIRDALDKFDTIKRQNKLCHIKVVPNTEDIFLDKKKWFEDRGFVVIRTDGFWANDHESHAQGLINDMAKCYNHPLSLSSKFILNLENDWIFEDTLKVNGFDELLYDSFDILDRNPNLIYHRYSRVDQKDIVTRLNANHVGNNLFITDREFSFNPFIARSMDMKNISNFVLNSRMQGHVETIYERCAHYLNNRKDIFSFTNTNNVYHIGWPETYKEFTNRNKI